MTTMKSKHSFHFCLVLLSLLLTTQYTLAQYCSPLYTNNSCTSNDFIDSLAINTLMNGSTGCATDGINYSDFTSLSTNLTQGSSYTISIKSENVYGQAVTVYIDFDQNNVFDANEQVFFHAADTALMTGTILVSSNAVVGSTRMRVRGVYNQPTASDPCANYPYGETEDYTINIMQGINCAGAPAASNTLISDDSVCVGELVSLSLDFTYSGVGINYQWQSSPNGTSWTDITGANNPLYSLNVLSIGYYQCIISCAGGSNTTSTPVAVYLNPFMTCYCSAYNPPCSGSDYISNVSITSTTLNNNSVCSNSTTSNYTDYSTTVAAPTVVQGATYPMSVTTADDHSISVWIDANQDGIYDASEWTQVATTTLANAANVVNVTIPLTTTIGQTMMRVRARLTGNLNGATDACLSMGSGETEDYAINITAAAACSGTPTASNTVSSVVNACLNQPFDLSLSSVYANLGLTFQWQSSINGISWVNIAGANTVTYTTMQTGDTYYRCVISCNGNVTVSTPIMIGMNGFMDCYCMPSYQQSSCSSEDYIDSVFFNTIANGSTGCAVTTDNYSDYTNISTIVELDSTYQIAIQPSLVFSQGTTVFIDYNHDAIFDSTTEIVFFAPSSSNLQVGTITIPATAMIGATAMRVRCVYGSLNPAHPCNEYTYGETEDYKIIIQAAGGSRNIEVTNVIAPNSACALTSQEIVAVTITNKGTTTLNVGEVSVDLLVAGANNSNFTLTNTMVLAPNDVEVLTFTPINLSITGTNVIDAMATLANDIDLTNNQSSTTTTSYGTSFFNQVSTICQGDSFVVGNSIYYTTGTYTNVFTTINGCDSVVLTNLTVTPSPTHTSTVAVCQGSSLTINGQIIAPLGNMTYTYYMPNTVGCDSLYVVNIVVNSLPIVTIPSMITDCPCPTIPASGAFTYQWSTGQMGQSIQVCVGGTYWVTGTDINGCSGISDTCQVNLMTPLTASASAALGANGSVNFICAPAGTGPYTYSWNFGDNTTSTLPNPTHTYNPNGTYQPSVTVTGMCGDTTIFLQVNITNVSIKAQNLQENINIYPNPNQGKFVVNSLDLIADKVSLELFDVQGKSLYRAEEKVNNGFTHEIKVANLSKGVYLLKVSDGKGVTTQKIMID